LGRSPGFGRGARFPGKCRIKELRAGTIQAYNDWHFNDWCARIPGAFQLRLGDACRYGDVRLGVFAELKRFAETWGGHCHSPFPGQTPRDRFARPGITAGVGSLGVAACGTTAVLYAVHIGSPDQFGRTHPGRIPARPPWITSMPMSIRQGEGRWAVRGFWEAITRAYDGHCPKAASVWISVVSRAGTTSRYGQHQRLDAYQFRQGESPATFRPSCLTCFHSEDEFGLRHRARDIGREIICLEGADYPPRCFPGPSPQERVAGHRFAAVGDIR